MCPVLADSSPHCHSHRRIAGTDFSCRCLSSLSPDSFHRAPDHKRREAARNAQHMQAIHRHPAVPGVCIDGGPERAHVDVHRHVEREVAPGAEQGADEGLLRCDHRRTAEPSRLRRAQLAIPEAQPGLAGDASRPDGGEGGQRGAGQGVEEAVRRFAGEKEEQDGFEVDEAVGEREGGPAHMPRRRGLEEGAGAEVERSDRHGGCKFSRDMPLPQGVRP